LNAESLFSVAESALERAGVTPGMVYSAAERVGLGSVLLDATPASVRQAVGKTADWRRSAAYCRSRNRLGVRINLEGREPDGVVPPEEYESVRTRVIDALSSLTTPDGEPAFEWVRRREEVYDGTHLDDADDVLLMPTGMNNTLSASLYGRTFTPTSGYDHKPNGVFIGAGPDLNTAVTPAGLTLIDVAPLVMALLGHPIPQRMTGTVPHDLVSSTVRRDRYREVPFGEPDGELERSEVGERGVKERLGDLGYL
jgi:predicted AlkP superfamily phosphohydrolase/phosphomutase